MRRRIKKSTPNSAMELPKVQVVRSKKKAQSLAENVYDLRVQQDVLNLHANGVPMQEIAASIGITKAQVVQYIARALEDYYADRNEVVQQYLALTHARYNKIFLAWFPRATEERREKIKVKRGDEEVEEEIVTPPDPEAARIVLKALNDYNRMMGFNKIRVEHTGANGAPIAMRPGWEQNLSDEQLEKFARTGDVSIIRSLP